MVRSRRWRPEQTPMMKFAGFQSTLFEFLEQLADNNDRL
jgi:hypothetical protein